MAKRGEVQPRTTGCAPISGDDDAATCSRLPAGSSNSYDIINMACQNFERIHRPEIVRAKDLNNQIVPETTLVCPINEDGNQVTRPQNIDKLFGNQPNYFSPFMSLYAAPHTDVQPRVDYDPPLLHERQKSIFLTYVLDSCERTPKKSIMQIASTLEGFGFNIRLADAQEQLLSISITDWLNDSIDKSDFVIVCVNKVYKRFATEPPDASQDESVLQAYHVFSQLQIKYIFNGSLNYNVIPVLVDGARAYEHLPNMLKNTIIYRWPADKQKLLKRLSSKTVV